MSDLEVIQEVHSKRMTPLEAYREAKEQERQARFAKETAIQFVIEDLPMEVKNMNLECLESLLIALPAFIKQVRFASKQLIKQGAY